MGMVFSHILTIKCISKQERIITSNLPCEIYTTDGTLTLNTIEHVQSAIFTDHQGNDVQLPIQQAPHTMTEEVAALQT